MQKLAYIVTGASGKLGRAFIECLSEPNNKVIAVSRRPAEDIDYVADLLQMDDVMKICEQFDISNYDEVRLIHTVGKFKFEPAEPVTDPDGDGIDDEVFATNVLTLKNLLTCLVQPDAPLLKICAFASISDRYDIPYWSSYTRAKNIMRRYLRALTESGVVQALVVNVSSVDTGNENILRPHADTTYWLQPREIAEMVLPLLNNIDSYSEVDIIKEKPDFDSNYYRDREALFQKWQKEMGR